jgi:hypothetical protein
MPGDKFEIVVDGGDFDPWLAGLEAEIRRAMA